jgi:hypothetical protein
MQFLYSLYKYESYTISPSEPRLKSYASVRLSTHPDMITK